MGLPARELVALSNEEAPVDVGTTSGREGRGDGVDVDDGDDDDAAMPRGSVETEALPAMPLERAVVTVTVTVTSS